MYQMKLIADARQNMVDSQLRPNRVTNPNILSVMSDLPREYFVPTAKKDSAYIDEDIEVSSGRYLMEPLVVARLIQALEITIDSTVLNVGCGSGYDSALLSMLAGSVVALESDSELVLRATEVLEKLTIDNVTVIEAPMTRGCSIQSPYDAILISGAIDEVPKQIFNDLAEGGRLAAVIGGDPRGIPGRAHIFIKTGESYSSRPLFDAGTKLLPGFQSEEKFVFNTG